MHESNWTLVDARQPFETRGAPPETSIHSREHLAHALTRMRRQRPGVVIVRNSPELAVKVGIGDPYGFVVSLAKNSTSYGKAALYEGDVGVTMIVFSNQGVDEPFWVPNLLPAPDVIRIVTDFYLLQDVPQSVEWGERVWKHDDF
jgi:hypothetical protein